MVSDNDPTNAAVIELQPHSQGKRSINEGKICPYCGAATKFLDSSVVYNKSFGMIYICQPCNAYVGVHKGSTLALGRLANDELRYWKKEAHAHFDPIWRAKLTMGQAKSIVRNEAYDWLCKEMQMNRGDAHIGFMDVEQCKQLVEVCKPVLLANQLEPEKVFHKTNTNRKEETLNDIDLQKEKYLEKKNNQQQFGMPLPKRETRYECFEELWFPQFKNALGDDFWYDQKKFCYTYRLLKDGKPLYIDYYPKSDKLLKRQENKWISPGLIWLAKNILNKGLDEESKYVFL